MLPRVYDFQLLKAEIALLSKTLCSDSYLGIQEIFKRREWKAQQQNGGISRSKKRLNFTNIGRPRSYFLINLCEHLLGCYPTQSHSAEADWLTLKRTTAV